MKAEAIARAPTAENRRPTPLQARCACGKGARTLSGRCEACQRADALGLQRKTLVGAADDPFEREADHAAEAALGAARGGRRTAPAFGAPRLRRRAFAGASVGHAPASVDRTLSATGEPLAEELRSDFGERFGHDFGHVRVHRDAAAAQSAREVGARAYTAGRHVVFGSGQYAPQSLDGRRLIAHELAHVVQQAGSAQPALRREPEEAVAESGWIAVEVSTDPEYEGHNRFLAPAHAGEQVDLGTAYRGDVLLIRRFDGSMEVVSEAVEWTLPAELEVVEESPSGLQVRVADSAASGELALSFSDGSGAQTRLALTVGDLPARPQAVNPEFERLRGERDRLRKERVKARREARAARRTLRRQQREARRSSRRARREQRKALRAQARELRQAARALRRAESCDESTELHIQAALERAINVAGRAVARLQAGDALADGRVAAAMTRYMRWTPSEPASASSRRHLARIVDTLVVARNSMTLALHGDFQCTQACKPTTGAYVRDGSRKQGEVDSGVWVCPAWINGQGLRFPVVQDTDGARSYALLHEFVHKSGPTAEENPDEDTHFYVGRPAWNSLDATAALGYADGYAALAWTLAAEGGGDGP